MRSSLLTILFTDIPQVFEWLCDPEARGINMITCLLGRVQAEALVATKILPSWPAANGIKLCYQEPVDAPSRYTVRPDNACRVY